MSEDYKIIEGRVYRRWEKDVTKPRLKGGISYEESFHMLVNICMTCPPEEFPKYVNRLFYSTPTTWKDEELWDALEEATEEVEYATSQTFCNVPVANCPEMPSVVRRSRETDWHKLFTAILDCANRRNLLIPMERVEVMTEKE